MMKAVLFEEFGGPEVLRIGQVPEPTPGPGQVRIAVRTVGVNGLDWKIRSGFAPFPVSLPHIPGIEAAGIVDAIGPDTAGASVGDEVFGLAVQATAEHAILTAFAAKPAALSWEEAAVVAVSAETAARVLEQLGLASGHTLVINGAAGGVGSAAVQLAVAAGATVVGTASAANHDHLRELGAVPVAYGPGLVERVRELAPEGVDLALDAAGYGSLRDLIALTGTPEHVLTIADPGAAELGVRFSAGGAGVPAQALAHVARLIAAGEFHVRAGASFALQDIAAAHDLSQQGHAQGKPVIVIDAQG